MSERVGNRTRAALAMVVECNVFLRGVLAGVGSIFGAMLAVGGCRDELDVASWEN